MKLQLEVNEQFRKAVDTVTVPGGVTMQFTPPLSDEYWIFRVKLKDDQAILGFPKFGTIGCGFAQEEDWNTNLPVQTPAEQIYNHIKHNKKYRAITKAQCLEAIEMVRAAGLAFLSSKTEPEKEQDKCQRK